MTPSPEVKATSRGEQEGAEFHGLFLFVTLDSFRWTSASPPEKWGTGLLGTAPS